MADKPSVLLVNGNSTEAVTARLARLAHAAAPQLDIVTCTPPNGPTYVSTPEDVVRSAAGVIEAIEQVIRDRGSDPDGCIIACFGEPGLRAARRHFRFPVVGMAEASMLTAMQLGEQFAIVTLGEHWPAMLRDLVREYRVQDRCADIRRIEGAPLDLLADPISAAQSVADAARQTEAATVIIGGAALTGLLPFIDPIPGVRFVDCLLASIAQIMALIAYRRMVEPEPL